ncbi:hypothetical protein ACE1BM_10905, partial [Aeromonas jandaei]
WAKTPSRARKNAVRDCDETNVKKYLVAFAATLGTAVCRGDVHKQLGVSLRASNVCEWRQLSWGMSLGEDHRD